MNYELRTKGFTLVEVLLVTGILVVLAATIVSFYWDYAKRSELDLTAKEIIYDLKGVQASAMAGEDSLRWGIHFVNSADDYYELFSTPTDYSDVSVVIKATNYLASGVYFTQPVSSSTIIFDRIRGTTAATSTIIISSLAGGTKIITITPIGNIY